MIFALYTKDTAQTVGLSRKLRRGFGSGVLLMLTILTAAPLACAGTWTPVVNQNPEYYNETMLLLSDGSVIVHSYYDPSYWTRLTPDASGSYVNGTWTTLPPMSTGRLNFASLMLSDGRVLVLGGQYTGRYGGTKTDTNTGETYDPVANRWVGIAPYPETKFGANPAVIQQYGYVLAGGKLADTWFYYPPYDYWFAYSSSSTSTTGDPKLRSDVNDNETWLLAPDGSIVSYDVNASITNNAATAQKFSFSSGSWVDAGTLPFLLTTTAQASKLGPGSMLPNGKMFLVGGNELTAIYTPASGTGTGSWVTGPSLPSGMGADSAPGALLPDGHFIFVADKYQGTSPTRMYDYNYATNTLTDITSTLPSLLQSYLSFTDSNSCRMVLLPNGGLLFTTGYNDLWEYKTSGTPLDSWRPMISTVTKISGGNYTVSGYRFNGISEGVKFGAGAGMATNYPIVRLDQVGKSYYARTSNWTPGISRPNVYSYDSIDVAFPAGLPNGTYYLSVITNGISSLSTPITFKRGVVTASFSNGTLTVNGDSEANNISVTYKQVKVQGVVTDATVTVTAGDGYNTINGQNSVTFNVGINRINANFQMGAGDDTVSISSLFASNVVVNLADGNDTATLLYNSISTQLVIDGGAGTDTVTLTGNSITKTTKTSVP